ncbi:MAG: hypothetical protein WDN28_24640 [Chthoniobacter sp.]
MKLQSREILRPQRVGDLVVQDAVETGNQGSAKGEREHERQLAEWNFRIEEVHGAGEFLPHSRMERLVATKIFWGSPFSAAHVRAMMKAYEISP